MRGLINEMGSGSGCVGQEGLGMTPSWDTAPGRDPGGQEEPCKREGETRREDCARRLSQTLYLRNQAVKAVRSRCEWLSACLRTGLGWKAGVMRRKKEVFLHLMSLPALAPGRPG